MWVRWVWFRWQSRWFGNFSNTSTFYILQSGDSILTGDFFRRKRYQSDRKVFVRASNFCKIYERSNVHWSLVFMLLTSKKLVKGQMFRVFALLTIIERPYVQGVCNFYTRSNIQTFKVFVLLASVKLLKGQMFTFKGVNLLWNWWNVKCTGIPTRPSLILSWRFRPTLLCTPKGLQLLGPWSLH